MSMQPESLIPLRFSAQQLDYIANALGRCPYIEVQPLLADIGRQVQMHNEALQAQSTYLQTADGGASVDTNVQ